MSHRAARRRKKRASTGEPAPQPSSGLRIGRTNQIALAFLVVGLVVSGVVVLAVSSLTGGDGEESAAANPSGSDTGGPTTSVSAADEEEIRTLAARSIDVLPAGEWPSLYEEFTVDFRNRCTIAEFTQAGVDTANVQGAALQQLAFKDLKDLSVTGARASATIVGHYKNQANSDYDIQAAFAREGGRWKLTPAPNTEGCSAFNVLG